MKKFLGILSVIVLAAIVTYGAYVGFPVPEKKIEVHFSDYNTDDVVVLGEYKNVEVDVTYTAVTEENILKYINEVLAYNPDYEPIEDTVVDDGDIVDLDYIGYYQDEEFDKSEKVYLEIGSDQFVDGFEDQLIGVKVGETVAINLTFPEDYKDYYGNPVSFENSKGEKVILAGANVVFTVTINSVVKEVVKTFDEVDDSYCYTNYGFETKQALYDYVKKQMETEAESEKKSKCRENVLAVVVQNSRVEVPQELLDVRVDEYIESFKSDVEAAGYDFEEYLSETYKYTEEDLRKEIASLMKDSLEEQFVLAAIAKAENIVLDEEGYAQYVQSYVTYYGYKSEEELYKDYPEDEMKTAYLCNDVLDFLVENATVQYVGK